MILISLLTYRVARSARYAGGGRSGDGLLARKWFQQARMDLLRELLP
ncbi:hypothetical protein BMS3Abin13_00111 [bacterium BMS3Abin13]|nr:hypothetical protein BMS3Abin13_00111 [bacterium BMS3Abin13]